MLVPLFSLLSIFNSPFNIRIRSVIVLRPKLFCFILLLVSKPLPLSDIIILTSISDFNAPNSYEAALQDFNFYGKKKLGICSEKSFLINLPVNITQSEITNKSGSIKLDDYLKAWENKKKLNIEVLENYNPYSVHEEHILLLIDR